MSKNILSMLSYRLIIPMVLCVGIVLVILSLSMTETNFKASNSKISVEKKQLTESDDLTKAMAGKENFWKTLNLQELEIPKNIKNEGSKIDVASKNVKVMDTDTFYREATPPSGITATGQSVLLLHGMAFTSKTWLDLGTIRILAAMGHRVVAIDLPGFGETKKSLRGSKDDYLNELLNALHLQNVVIVSPSMSGSFSIPFILKFSAHVSGYAPVAPVNTELLKGHEQSIMTPTLIIYGELDKSLGYRSRDDLLVLPNSQAVMLPNSKHPAYLDQPDLFHKLLYNFLLKLKDHK